MSEDGRQDAEQKDMASKAHADVHQDETDAAQGTTKLKIFRGDGEGGKEVEYELPAVEGMVVLDAVLYVQAHQAGDLAVRWNCKAAHCGSCSAEINGKPKLLCKSRVEEYEGQEIRVHPLRAFPVIKDLVSDVSWNYEVARSTIPFQSRRAGAVHHVRGGRGEALRAEEVHRVLYVPGRLPRAAHAPQAPEFAGPRSFVRNQWLEMHPKDIESRVEWLKEGRGGIGYCNITKCCSEVCPGRHPHHRQLHHPAQGACRRRVLRPGQMADA
jgi:succinate dehydrogenase / fumarate reductase iron-sulfur subunit